MAAAFSVRAAKLGEQSELTRLCVRATSQTGYDQAFIDRAMAALTITAPMIARGGIRVVERKSGEVVGFVAVKPTALQAIALLDALFVDPDHWRNGIGRMLFDIAVAHAGELNAGALLIQSEPSAEGFYERMGAVRIGTWPFVLSPEIEMPQLLHIISRRQTA